MNSFCSDGWMEAMNSLKKNSLILSAVVFLLLVRLIASGTDLSAGDKGIGMPGGIDPEDTDTLGLSLVSALVGQLQGTLELKRENGTWYVIRFY